MASAPSDTSTVPPNVAAAAQLLVGRPGSEALSRELLGPVVRPPSLLWLAALGLTGLGTVVFVVCIVDTLLVGIGEWGNNIPVGWAFAIVNFVFWIEIAHTGTFISAVLHLCEQRWRTSINRIAEAMTLFAVVQAGIFPAMHLGRAWFAYWLLPYPSIMRVWPQFRSSLPWDFAAVATYALVSFIFWYMGLLPDFAELRDRAPGTIRRAVYGVLALGWRGAGRFQRHYRVLYGALAGIATALVVSVISVVSSDFAIAILPGWHSTIFPPYFIFAALYSGFGLVTVLLVLVRAFYRMQNVITERHFDVLGKMLLLTGSLTFYAYVIEFFTGWYSADPYERYTYWRGYWLERGQWVWVLTLLFTLTAQAFWSARVRRNPVLLTSGAALAVLGMWGDRFGFVVLALQRDFLPSSWHAYSPTLVDWGMLWGSGSFFAFLFLLFVRFVPPVPVAEIKRMAEEIEKGQLSRY